MLGSISLARRARSGPPGASQQYANETLWSELALHPPNRLQWSSNDRGACYLGGLAAQPIKLTHFGMWVLR